MCVCDVCVCVCVSRASASEMGECVCVFERGECVCVSRGVIKQKQVLLTRIQQAKKTSLGGVTRQVITNALSILPSRA